MCALVFLQACIKSPSSARKSIVSSSTTTTNKTTTLPTFTTGNNFIQNGGTVYTSTVSFDISFADVLYLRGKDVDSYIRNNGTSTISCLTGRFTAALPGQIIVTAAVPHSVYNYTTNSLEYYYTLAPSDETTNKNFCQKSGVINKLYSLYPTLTPAYYFGALCPSSSCVSSSFTSLSLELYSQSGVALTQVATKQLAYSLTNKPATATPVGKTCVTNAECTAQNYDCCSLGQCVKDRALKDGVNTASPDYIQALADILNNPSHIYNYTQYYYLCSSSSGTTPTTPTTNPTTDAAARVQALTDLYNCTTKLEGEMGICTTTVDNAEINTPYYAGIDDRSFSNTYTNQPTSTYTPPLANQLIAIQNISYGEVTLFDYDQITSESAIFDGISFSPYFQLVGHHNDDNATGTKVTIVSKPSSAVSKKLVIRYKIDASCTQLNSTLGKCEKYYVQGQQSSGDTLALNRRGRVTDHFPASNTFLLPYYASTDKTITVEVDGVTQKPGTDWDLSPTGNAVVFYPSSTGGLRVFDTQKVKITFFVNLGTNHVMDSKLAALNTIKTKCSCADLNCALAPIKNDSGTVTDYSCVYPDPIPPTPPLTQTIYLSSKTVPVRYFDQSGVSQAAVTGSTLAQEGTAFSYRKDNLLNPSNVADITNPVAGDYYVGFNEIYGSLSYTTNSAKPAKEIPVTKGKLYDIYVDNGTYSNCVQCGNDYYSQLNKLFPLAQFGGGIVPLQSRTDRTAASGIRADDMSFGRACFVPATMIPWTHTIDSNPQTQRMNRMRAQHFLYANGYQHDWYGFDYGAVIGSFDGVKWFAIGSNRRIKADSTKLFLAVNGPFGDLALESTYTVTINDGTLNPVGSNMVTTDFESDGADCQKFHQCTTDNDCATTLGWDYVCSTVNDITTTWPRFDDNGKEIPDATRDDNSLISILGISTSGKRCVYRGRGAACTPNYLASAINLNGTFNQTQNQSLHTCSSNNYCQSISNNSNTALNPNFNNRISRYGKVRTDDTTDSFGLGAKVPGRPMDFNGSETIRSESIRNFNSNRLGAICIPGRTPEADTFVAQNSTAPDTDFLGDKILNAGMTYRKDSTPVTGVNTYLAACPVMDSTNNYFYAKIDDPTSSNSHNADLINSSATQSVSTNALNIFTSIFNTKGISFPLYKNNSTPISAQTFTENRCMRAPGASCFTDLDCAPSNVIATKMKMLSSDDTSVTNIINKYELKFWQEELICSQATAKSDSSYSSFNNRCCRDVGKTISLPSSDSNLPINMSQIAGVDINMSNRLRYTRAATLYKDYKNDPTNYPLLTAAVANQCSLVGGCIDTSVLTNQFKTFSAYAERTSCSGEWVRNFANGNHTWDKSRLQTFNTSMFRCMNWLPSGDPNAAQWTCAGLPLNDPSCLLIQTSPYSGKAKGVMNILAKLELMGIPQIAVESEEYATTTGEGDFSCRAFPTNQAACYPGNSSSNCVPDGLVNAGVQVNSSTNYAYPMNLYTEHAAAAITNASEYINSTDNKHLYSNIDTTNYQSMKQIFKADEVVGCFPAGTTMAVGADPALCCTGVINSQTNKCQLPDFVDVSVYTNRYVSSEAKKLSPSLIDQNGYIKDPSYVVQLACEKSMCASGKLAFGLLVSRLKTPGQEQLDSGAFRFLQGTTTSDDINGVLTLYNSGLKLNTHAYCYPANGSSDTSGTLTVISCNSN